MDLIKKGKTKDVYDLGDGTCLFKFKDDATVGDDGRPDPGGNKVGLSIKGLGCANLRLTDYFFRKIEAAGIPTQYISADIEKAEMTVRPAELLGGEGLEAICRFKATGSFIRRYGKYAGEGQDLPAFVEITIKDDGRGDPPISKDGLEALGILAGGEYDKLVSLTRKISQIIKDDLARKGIELYDIKLEFGRHGGGIILIDEISAGSVRAYKNGGPLSHESLVELVLL